VEVQSVDVIIDDGGHTTEQQIVTFEELFPILNPGGVYLCEDIHGTNNGFVMYLQGVIKKLNDYQAVGTETRTVTNQIQESIQAIHLYPYAVVITKNMHSVKELSAPKIGTKWQPFFK
jgi:hypothetical protein